MSAVVVLRSRTGTHVIEVLSAPDTALGVRARVAMSTVDGVVTGPFEDFVPSQQNWYRDMARILAEAVAGEHEALP